MKTIDTILSKCKKITTIFKNFIYPIDRNPEKNYDFSEDWPKDEEGNPLTPSKLLNNFYSNKP